MLLNTTPFGPGHIVSKLKSDVPIPCYKAEHFLLLLKQVNQQGLSEEALATKTIIFLKDVPLLTSMYLQCLVTQQHHTDKALRTSST